MSEKLQEITIKKLIETKTNTLKEDDDIKIKPKYRGLYGNTYIDMKSREAKERSTQMQVHDKLVKYGKDFLSYLRKNSIDFDNIESKMEYFTGEFNDFAEKPERLELRIDLIKDEKNIATINFEQQVYHGSTDSFNYKVDDRILLSVLNCSDNKLESKLDKLRRDFISANINDLCYTYRIYSDEYNKRS